jgi:hypothetical protein
MESDLTNPAKYPLTTQKGLSEEGQAFIDAINLDQGREMIENGEPMDDEDKARFAELEEKHRIRVERGRAEGIVFTGDYQPAEEPEPEKPVPTKNPERPDSEWAMTQEERDRVGKAHREMKQFEATQQLPKIKPKPDVADE